MDDILKPKRKSRGEPLEWNVYMENFNRKTIVVYNVFRHWSFREACRKALRKYKNEDQVGELEKEIKRWVTYLFWSKCEYEVIITGWPPPREDSNFRDIKIDVCKQLELNWNYFFKYILDHRKELLKKEPNVKIPEDEDF